MNTIKGLRVITNLYCNNNCDFCYQQDKSAKILNVDNLLYQVNPYNYKHF